MPYFPLGGANPQPTSIVGPFRQIHNTIIILSSPEGGQTPLPTSKGGPWPDLPPGSATDGNRFCSHSYHHRQFTSRSTTRHVSCFDNYCSVAYSDELCSGQGCPAAVSGPRGQRYTEQSLFSYFQTVINSTKASEVYVRVRSTHTIVLRLFSITQHGTSSSSKMMNALFS